MNSSVKILVIDDEGPIRQVLSASLKDEGYTVFLAEDGESGLAAIDKYQPNVVFLDIWMPGKLDGIEVLQQAKKMNPSLDVVMMSGHGTIETAVKATKLGAWDFIEKPLSIDKILVVLQNVLNYQVEKIEKAALLNRLRRNIALLGDSQQYKELKKQIAQHSLKASPLFIRGENGTGKDLVAQNIHYLSSRAGRVFVEVSCAKIADDLSAHEFYGYEKGQFPGADRASKGKFELAEFGTIYLDEITALGPKGQKIIEDFLINSELKKIGESQAEKLDIRLLVSSSISIEKSLKEGKISLGLAEALKNHELVIPSLKDHPEDIHCLVDHFSSHFVRDGSYPLKSISERARAALTSYAWPGNIRELKNFIERLYILTPGDFVDLHDLRFAGLFHSEAQAATLASAQAAAQAAEAGGSVAATQGDLMGTLSSDELDTFRDARAKFEKEYLIRKLQENEGNISRTAEQIGLERSYLHRKIKSYGIDV